MTRLRTILATALIAGATLLPLRSADAWWGWGPWDGWGDGWGSFSIGFGFGGGGHGWGAPYYGYPGYWGGPWYGGGYPYAWGAPYYGYGYPHWGYPVTVAQLPAQTTQQSAQK